MSAEHSIFVLIGPTASGKSAAAMDVARARGGVIINADAMQMYSDLHVITARPTSAEMENIPHKLYGVLEATVHGNAALWCDMVAPEIEAAWADGKLPILVGGTGMYIKCLMEGMAAVPEISEEVRAEVREMLVSPPTASPASRTSNLRSPLEGGAGGMSHDSGADRVGGALYQKLQQLDPLMAARLQPNDTQRIVRALEVMLSTGRSLAEWQEEKTPPAFPDAEYECFYLDPPRDILYERINLRFEQMMEHGALAEVAGLMKKLEQISATSQEKSGDIQSSQLPILKAHGVPELMAHLRGEMRLEDAIAKAQQNTRNYAKRQMTWIRGQIEDIKLYVP